jgi:hypothetical protein
LVPKVSLNTWAKGIFLLTEPDTSLFSSSIFDFEFCYELVFEEEGSINNE